MPGWFDTLRSWLWPMAPGTYLPGTNPFPIASDPSVADPWGSDAYRDGQWSPVIAPVASNPEADQIRADAYVPPYSGPLDLDDHGRETAEMRRAYRDFHRSEPAIRSAIDGKAAAVAALDVSVLPEDKDSALDRAAAEFVDWTVRRSRDGWDGLILTILRPALIDGFSIAEKVLRGVDDSTRWWGFHGLRHVKSRDTQYLMLRLDAYRNVLGVVSTVRGLRTFDPAKVILFTHAELFDSPFGQSDLRAAYRSAGLIADAYKLWHIALRLYSQPYAHGKVTHPGSRPQMEAALKSLRASGWAVTPKDDDIALLNLASATGYDAFERKVRILREDIFLAVRGAYTPFMQSNSGAGEARGDTAISQGVGSDPVEELLARSVGRCLTRELVPDLVRANFGPGVGLPSVVLGGVNWGALKDRLDIIERAKSLKLSVSAKWAHDILQIPPATDPDDELGGATAPDSDSPGGGPAPAGAGAPPGGADTSDKADNSPPDTPSDGFPELIRAMLQAKADGDEEAVARLGELARDPQKLAATVAELRAKGAWGEDDEEGPRTFSAGQTVWMAGWHKDPTERSPGRITNDQNPKQHEYGKTAEEILKAQEHQDKGGATDPAQGSTPAPAEAKQPKAEPAAAGTTATPRAKKGGKKSKPTGPDLISWTESQTKSLDPHEKAAVAAHIGGMTPGQASETLGAAKPDAKKDKRAQKLRAEVDKKTTTATEAPGASAGGPSVPAAPPAKAIVAPGDGVAGGPAPTKGPPHSAGGGGPPHGGAGGAPAGVDGPYRAPVLGTVADIKALDKDPDARHKLIIDNLLPADWKSKLGKARNSKQDLNRDQERAQHLSGLATSDLYGLIHHYANSPKGKELQDWAASANEVLMGRLLAPAGVQRDLRNGWDAHNQHAVYNFKMLTGGTNAQDNFRHTNMSTAVREMKKSPHRDKGFARITLHTQKNHSALNGVHIYPGFGQSEYTGNRSGHTGPRMLASLGELENWVDGKDGELSKRVSDTVNNTDWAKEKETMKADKNRRDRITAKELLQDNPHAVRDELHTMKPQKAGEVVGHMTSGLSVEHRKNAVSHLTADLPADHKGDIAADLLKSLPPEVLAKVMESVGAQIKPK